MKSELLSISTDYGFSQRIVLINIKLMKVARFRHNRFQVDSNALLLTNYEKQLESVTSCMI